MSEAANSFFGLVPMLVGTLAVIIEQVRHILDRDLQLGNLGIIKGLSVSGSEIFKQGHNPLDAARGDVDVDVTQGVTFILGNFAVAEDPVIQDGQAPRILVANHPGQLGLRDHVIHQGDIINGVAGSRVVCGLDDSTVVVEGEPLCSKISWIRETFHQILNEDTTLAERIHTLFREQGITIASILTALGMTISTLVLALTGGSGGTPTRAPPSEKGGQRSKRLCSL